MEHYKETGEKLHGREARTQASPPIQPHGTAQSVFVFTQMRKATTVTELIKRLGTDTASVNQSQRAKSAKNNTSPMVEGKATAFPFFMPSVLPPGGLISS